MPSRKSTARKNGAATVAGEDLKGSLTKTDNTLDNTRRMVTVICRADTGRACLHVGSPFHEYTERDTAAINENFKTTSVFFREATPFDYIWYEMPEFLRKTIAEDGSRLRLVKGAFRGENSRLAGQGGYFVQQGTARSAVFDAAGHLIGWTGDDFKGYPAKTEFDEDSDVTDKLLNPSRVPFGGAAQNPFCGRLDYA